MNVNWNRVGAGAARAATVVYFAVTGSFMTRVITKVAVSPVMGAISGAIFGVLWTSTGKKDLSRVLNILLLNPLVTLPFSLHYHTGDTAIIVAAGLTALHIANLCVISTIFSAVIGAT